jgi:hypothetical protein
MRRHASRRELSDMTAMIYKVDDWVNS